MHRRYDHRRFELVLGVERGHLDEETADEWLDTWRDERGYYAPMKSIGELLNEDRGVEGNDE